MEKVKRIHDDGHEVESNALLCKADPKNQYCESCGNAMWRKLKKCHGVYTKVGTRGYDELYHIDPLKSSMTTKQIE